MWIPQSLLDLLTINRDTYTSLREEVSSLTVERDLLKTQLLVANNSMEWIRHRINTLEEMNTGLIEKAYNITLPTPQLERTTPRTNPTTDPLNFSFDHIDDDTAKKLGIAHLLS